MDGRNTSTGFTLVDMLMTIAILWILIGIAVPSFTDWVRKNRLQTLQDTIYFTLQTARTMSVTGQKNIHVCGSNDGETCEKIWNNYLLVFDDTNDDHEPNPEELLLAKTIQINGTFRTRAAFGRPYTEFTYLGSAVFTGSIIVCHESNDPRDFRRVTWNRAGRTYIGRDRDEDGLIDDTDGDPITC